MSQDYLFLCGCARSGTSALWRLLSANKYIVIGLERYINKCSSPFELTPELYQRDRFYDLQPGDTHFKSLEKGGSGTYYTNIKDRFDSAKYVGDKIPRLFKYYNQIFDRFPKAKIIFIYRNIFDVSQSFNNRFNNPEDNWNRDYKVAIKEWNLSLKNTHTQIKKTPDSIMLIAYEELFFNNYDFTKIYNFLGLTPDSSLENRFEILSKKAKELESKRQVQLSSLQKQEICASADFTLYNQIKSLTQ